jgi:hypothetical protein
MKNGKKLLLLAGSMRHRVETDWDSLPVFDQYERGLGKIRRAKSQAGISRESHLFLGNPKKIPVQAQVVVLIMIHADRIGFLGTEALKTTSVGLLALSAMGKNPLRIALLESAGKPFFSAKTRMANVPEVEWVPETWTTISQVSPSKWRSPPQKRGA